MIKTSNYYNSYFSFTKINKFFYFEIKVIKKTRHPIESDLKLNLENNQNIETNLDTSESQGLMSNLSVEVFFFAPSSILKRLNS